MFKISHAYIKERSTQESREETKGNTEQKEGMIKRKECGSISGKNDQKSRRHQWDTRKSNREITRHLAKPKDRQKNSGKT